MSICQVKLRQEMGNGDWVNHLHITAHTNQEVDREDFQEGWGKTQAKECGQKAAQRKANGDGVSERLYCSVM